MSRNSGIKHHQQPWPQALRMELLRHFIGNQSSITRAAQQVRSLRIKRPHLLDVSGCKFFHAYLAYIRPRDERGLECIKRLIGSQSLCQLLIEKNVASDSVDAKEWNARSIGLNGRREERSSVPRRPAVVTCESHPQAGARCALQIVRQVPGLTCQVFLILANRRTPTRE